MTELEMECLNAFVAGLPSELADIAAEQRSAVDAVVRIADGKRVAFQYFWRPVETMRSFENREIELHTATLRLERAAGLMYCDVVCEKGVLAGLEFSLPSITPLSESIYGIFPSPSAA